MIKIFTALVLVCYSVFASSIFGPDGKIKAASFQNNIVTTKIILDFPSVPASLAKRRNTKVEYVKEMRLFADDELVLKAKLSPYLQNRPFFKFVQKNIDAKRIRLEYSNNYNKKKYTSIKMAKRKRNRDFSKMTFSFLRADEIFSRQIEFKDVNKDAVSKIFGDVNLIEKNVSLFAPDLAANGGSIPLVIRHSIEVKSVTVFTTSDSYKKMYFTCSFDTIGKYKILEYYLRFKMRESGYAQVVVESKDGKFYTAHKYIEVSIAGGN